MNQQIFISLSMEELKAVITDCFNKCLDEKPILDKIKVELINGDELCKKLGITIQTLIVWRNKGRVPFIQLGSSIRYDLNKVVEALQGKQKGYKKVV